MSTKSGSLEKLLEGYLNSSRYSGEAKTYKEYVLGSGSKHNKTYASGVEAAIANKQKSQSGYGNLAESLASQGIRGGYADLMDQLSKNELNDKIAALKGQLNTEQAKQRRGYLNYLEKYSKEQQSIMERVSSQLLKNNIIDTNASYELAISSGLSEANAKEVSTRVYNTVRTKIIGDILSNVACMIMDPKTATAYARDKGLNEEDIDFVRTRAEEYYKTYQENAGSYLDYLESISQGTTNTFK